jgi:hypothetical protein
VLATIKAMYGLKPFDNAANVKPIKRKPDLHEVRL